MHRWLMIIAAGLLVISVAFAEPESPVPARQVEALQPVSALAVPYTESGKMRAAAIDLYGRLDRQRLAENALLPVAVCM